MNGCSFTAVHIVPTGLGAQIGGFAGDATPATNLLSQVCDRLLVHPNVVNAADLMEANDNIIYTEGRMLDDFMREKIALRIRRANRIGIVIDRNVCEPPPEAAAIGAQSELNRILNAVNAVRAVNGINISGYTITMQPVGARVVLSSTGASHGYVDNFSTVIDAAQRLIAAGAEAIAIITRVLGVTVAMEEVYANQGGPDPIGGIEAILSHLIVAECGVPAAHAPANSTDIGAFDSVDELVDPRVAAELIGHTFVPCILQGLARAPRIVAREQATVGDLTVQDVSAVIAPVNALGGIPMLEAVKRQIPLITVAENRTILNVTAAKLGITDHVIPAANYLETAGILAALKAGIDWRTVRRPLPELACV